MMALAISWIYLPTLRLASSFRIATVESPADQICVRMRLMNARFFFSEASSAASLGSSDPDAKARRRAAMFSARSSSRRAFRLLASSFSVDADVASAIVTLPAVGPKMGCGVSGMCFETENGCGAGSVQDQPELTCLYRRIKGVYWVCGGTTRRWIRRRTRKQRANEFHD